MPVSSQVLFAGDGWPHLRRQCLLFRVKFFVNFNISPTVSPAMLEMSQVDEENMSRTQAEEILTEEKDEIRNGRNK